MFLEGASFGQKCLPVDEILSVWTGPGSQASANPTTFISEYFSVEHRVNTVVRDNSAEPRVFGKRLNIKKTFVGG